MLVTKKTIAIYLFCMLILNQVWAAAPDWVVNANEYEYSMTITGSYYVDCQFSGEVGDQLGAFINGELRGMGEVTETIDNKPLIYLTVFSHVASGETISFMYYDQSTDEISELEAIAEFGEGLVIGGRTSPMTIFKNEPMLNPIIEENLDEIYFVDIPAYFETFQWFLDNEEIDNATNSTFYRHKAGSYHVEVTSTNGCKASSNMIFFEDAVILNVSTIKRDFEVYPNPTTEVLQVNFPIELKDEVELRLIDLGGNLIKRWTALPDGDNVLELNIGEVRAGIYSLEIYDQDVRVSQSRIVKI